MNNTCRDCQYCHELWYWDNYPQNKRSGFCCTFFKDTGEDVVMQLYGIDGVGCEEFIQRSDIHEEKSNEEMDTR